MSTRASYIFKDEYHAVCVYKHHDGYPEGAKEHIAKAVDFAWPLPRFEADEFGAAFVAANKLPDNYEKLPPEYRGGEVRLIPGGGDGWTTHTDIEYLYQIECVDGHIQVKAWEVDYRSDSDRWTQKPIRGWTVKPPQASLALGGAITPWT